MNGLLGVAQLLAVVFADPFQSNPELAEISKAAAYLGHLIGP